MAQEQSIEAVLVNPHLVKKNKENRDNTRSKSDKKDAFVIADMVKNGYYSPVRFHPEVRGAAILMANRETVVKRLVSAVNQIHRWVDIVFPELRQVFKILTCTSAIATLRLFPLPKEISRLNADQVLCGWKQYVRYSHKQHKTNDPHQLMHSQDDKKHGVSGDVTQKGSDPFR